jgi:hypothetical protein
MKQWTLDVVPKLEAEQKIEKLEAEVERVRKHEQETAEAVLRLAAKTEAERDQARNQERQRIQEALEKARARLEAMQGRQQNGEPHSRHWLQGEAHEIAKELRRLAALDTLDPSGEREPNAVEWCCDSCGLIAPEESKGWEQTGPDDAGVTVERCPDCRLEKPVSHPSGEQGEESNEDWPAVMVMREKDLPGPPRPSHFFIWWEVGDYDDDRYEVRRYVPATDTSKEERPRTFKPTIIEFNTEQTYESAFNAISQIIHAANPGQTVEIERHHADQDDRWFTVTVKPYATQVQSASSKEVGGDGE